MFASDDSEDEDYVPPEDVKDEKEGEKGDGDSSEGVTGVEALKRKR